MQVGLQKGAKHCRLLHLGQQEVVVGHTQEENFRPYHTVKLEDNKHTVFQRIK